jgi:hypothetical protein
LWAAWLDAVLAKSSTLALSESHHHWPLAALRRNIATDPS